MSESPKPKSARKKKVESKPATNPPAKKKKVEVVTAKPNLMMKGSTAGPSAANVDFKIPKKKVDVNLFQPIDLESREYISDILPILRRHCSRPTREALSFKYTKCTLIHNEALLEKFEEKRREMRQAKTDVNISYGFWQTFTGEEVNGICKNGLSKNYPFGTLGKPALGAYVSQYVDLLTAAPLLDGVHGTFIVFKVLKGRVKMVPVNQSGHLEPTPNYDCHGAKPEAGGSAVADMTPYLAFESNLVYLYDYQDVEILTPPRNVCPIAIIEYVYEDRANIPVWLKSENHVWSGNLRYSDGLSDDLETNMTLKSHLAKMKPTHLGEHLRIKKIVPAEMCLDWHAIRELRSKGTQGVLYKQKRDLLLKSGHYVSFFRLSTKRRSDEFNKVVTSMCQNNTVGLASLPGGTAILVLAASHFACQLGIPPLRDSSTSLYCVVCGFRSLVTGTGYTKDPYDTPPRVDMMPPDGNMVQPQKLMEVTQQFVDTQTAAGVRGLVPSPPTNGKYVPPQPPPAAQLDPPSAQGLLRDPRVQRRLQSTTGAEESQTKENKEATTSTAKATGLVLEHQPVDLEDPNTTIITLSEPSETDIEMEPQREPKIMPLENVEDAQLEGEALTEKEKADDHDGENEPSTSRGTTHSPPVKTKENEAIGKMDPAFLSIIYGGAMNKRHQTVQEQEPERPPAKQPLAESEEGSQPDSNDVSSPNAASKAAESKEAEETPAEASGSQDEAADKVLNEVGADFSRGVVVPDDLVLTKADPDHIERILQAFALWKNTVSADWRLKLHSQVVLKLANFKKTLSVASTAHKRATSMLVLCREYRSTGVVELLSEHACDQESRSASEYLPCLQQQKLADDVSQYILLSNVDPEGPVAQNFLESDILVMNVQRLMEYLGL